METTKKSRRNIYIKDDKFIQVGIEAAKKGIDKWEVIDKALEKYFGGDEERQG